MTNILPTFTAQYLVDLIKKRIGACLRHNRKRETSNRHGLG